MASDDKNSGNKTDSGPFFGLDVGTKRIGVARADATARIAMPLETVEAGRGARPAEYIAGLVTRENCRTIVVGWPLTLEGEEGRAVQKVRRFIDKLQDAIAELAADDAEIAAPEVVPWDERMTTTAAETFLIGANVSRLRRRKVVDQIAATHILQGYLDSLN
jgi:putative Holliday junction resolvase